jgi:hypothetical protein
VKCAGDLSNNSLEAAKNAFLLCESARYTEGITRQLRLICRPIIRLRGTVYEFAGTFMPVAFVLGAALFSFSTPSQASSAFWAAPILDGVAGGGLAAGSLRNNHRMMTAGRRGNTPTGRGERPHPTVFLALF